MNGIEALWSLPFARPVSWALAHFLWQGALVGILLAGALALSKKKSPSVRYAMAAGAMAVLLALPVITALWLAPTGEAGPAVAVPAAFFAPAEEPVPVGNEAPVSAEAASASRLQPLLPWFLVFWLAGVAVLSFYQLGGWLQARRLERRGTRAVAERWEEVVATLCARLGIARGVRILESSRVSVPAVVGWLRPVILVPASALTGLSPQQLEAILAHELAHVRRHDYLINLLQTVVETLLFYHPAVWWVSRVLRQEREHCCDDLAVAVCGDRLVYARALADLEGLRAPSPRLAMASDGGSLLARIQRLAGLPSGPSGRSWLAGALALGLLPSGMMIQVGGPMPGAASSASVVSEEEAPVQIAAAAPRAPEPAPVPQVAPAPAPAGAARRGNEQGVWTGERRKDGRIQLQLKRRSQGEKDWSFGTNFPASDLPGLDSGRFELRRDAGTFTFEGRFDGTGPEAQGAGTFSFQPDPGYVRDMASLGYRVEDKIVELALLDVSRASVRELRSIGYGDLSLDDLIEFAIFRVTPGFIREIGQLGFTDLPAKRLVEMRIHRITPEIVREWQSAGYQDLTLDRLMELTIHRATPEYVRELAALGLKDLSLEDVVELRIFRVTPEFIRELANLGYRDVSADEVVELRVHRIDPDFIREAREKEGRDLSIQELVDLRIQGRSRKARRGK
ncbi:MAG TPA: M56 family metallopeptidase [Thermoanaerobaculia bacterium]|nr:M56 family metallopeptidase [Thermoanaerobaculia bacterium]